MRSLEEIRRALIHLHFGRRIPFRQICQDARIDRDQLASVFSRSATERTIARLDLYLDCPELLHRRSASKIDERLLRLSEEICRLGGPVASYRMDEGLSDAEKWHRLRVLSYRAKKLLKHQLESKYCGLKIWIEDGVSYEYFKKKAEKKVSAFLSARRRAGPRARNDPRSAHGPRSSGLPKRFAARTLGDAGR